MSTSGARPGSATRTTLAWVLISALAAGAGCLNAPPEDLAVWSEFLPYDDVEPHLDALAAHSAALYLRVRPDDVAGPLWDLLERARARGIAWRLWLQFPANGTWLNEENVADCGVLARCLVAEARAHGIEIEWLVFDLEPGFAYAESLRNAAAAGNADELLRILSRHRDPVRFECAVSELVALVDELHAQGVRVMAATLPWIIDDLCDGDADFQDLFDTPLAHVPWDQACVMAYRPVFADLFGLPLSPEYVARYAQSARRAFGPTAQVALGNIGTPGLFVPVGYTVPSDLHGDVAAARSAGVQSISLFSLDGMVEQGGVERWLAEAARPTRWSRRPDPSTAFLRAALRGLDRLANAFPPGDAAGAAGGVAD